MPLALRLWRLWRSKDTRNQKSLYKGRGLIPCHFLNVYFFFASVLMTILFMILWWPWGVITWLLHKAFPDVIWAATLPLVGVPTPKQRQATLEAVLTSPSVRAAIAQEAERSHRPLKQVDAQAHQHAVHMAAHHHSLVLRLFAFLFKKVVPLLYSFGIHCNAEQISRAREAANRGASLVYVPMHKSHMDYLVLTYICLANGLPIPHVVAGDNLNIALVGKLLKSGGAFFIRRQFGKDPVYHAVFRAYVRELIANGHAVECFIESQRSRSGKVLLPKTGFLRCVADTVLDQDNSDACIVSVSLGYDRVLESNNYTVEVMGGKKAPERLQSLIAVVVEYLRRSWQDRLCYGRIDVGIAEPLSVREYINDSLQFYKAHNERKRADWDPDVLLASPMEPSSPLTPISPCPPSPANLERKNSIKRRNSFAFSIGCKSATVSESSESSPEFPPGPLRPQQPSPDGQALNSLKKDSKLRKYVATRLGYRCLYDCNQVAIVLPGVLVATVLVTRLIRGIAEDDLRREVEVLREEVEARGGTVARLQRSMSETIKAVVAKVLGMEVCNNQLVKRHKDFLMLSLWTPPEQLELSMMRNQLIHLFVMEAFVAVAMYAAEKRAYPAVVHRDALRRSCTFLMQLLKREFIYKPSEYGDPHAFDATMDFLVQRRILVQDGDHLIVKEGPTTKSKRDFAEPSTYLFLCSLLWPFVESYWLAAICLRRILGGKIIVMHAFVQQIQVIGERLFFEGHIDLYEAISSSILQNALKLFLNWGVLQAVEVVGSEEAGPQYQLLLRLSESYDSESAVNNLSEKILRFRKNCSAYRSRRYRQRMGTQVDIGLSIVRTISLSPTMYDFSLALPST